MNSMSFSETNCLTSGTLAKEIIVPPVLLRLRVHRLRDRESVGRVVLWLPVHFAGFPSRPEALTPDSSRFWPADSYRTGISPPSFDKQFVRDYLDTLDWDKTPPAPELPADILQKTAEKYEEALRRLTSM